MSGTNKLADKAQELKGKAQQTVGSATGDRDLQAQGLMDEKKDQVKQAGEKVKDVFS